MKFKAGQSKKKSDIDYIYELEIKRTPVPIPAQDPKTVELLNSLISQIRREHELMKDYNLIVEKLVTKYRDIQQ
jgi:hypothetical protein